MAYKMKGFSYPGKKPSPTKFMNFGDIFTNREDRPERGSLMDRIRSWKEKKRNKIQSTPEEKNIDPNANTAQANIEKQEELSKNPYAEDLGSKPEEEMQEEEIKDDSSELS